MLIIRTPLLVGSPAPRSVTEQWMAPASRLFSKLGYPKLNYDPVLYQELLILYRKLYTADGQRAAALLAAKQAAGPPASTGTVNRAGGSSGDASSGDHSSDADQPFGQRKRRQSSRVSMEAHLQQGQRSNAVPAHGAVQPLLTSQQELVLFMRWLNTTYDAMNKIQQVKDSSSGSAQAPADSGAKGMGMFIVQAVPFVYLTSVVGRVAGGVQHIPVNFAYLVLS
jgi:hypothetical protein